MNLDFVKGTASEGKSEEGSFKVSPRVMVEAGPHRTLDILLPKGYNASLRYAGKDPNWRKYWHKFACVLTIMEYGWWEITIYKEKPTLWEYCFKWTKLKIYWGHSDRLR